MRDRAAAGGPIIRLKISRAPTTGTVMAVARATTMRKQISIRWLRMPFASAISGTTEESMSGRYKTIDRRDADGAEGGDGQQFGAC